MQPCPERRLIPVGFEFARDTQAGEAIFDFDNMLAMLENPRYLSCIFEYVYACLALMAFRADVAHMGLKIGRGFFRER